MDSSEHVLPGWVTGGIVTIIVSLAGFIVGAIKYYLVKEAKVAADLQKANSDAITKLQEENEEFKLLAQECIKERTSQSVRIAVLEERAKVQDDNFV